MAESKRIWAYLIHLSYNMWGDWENPAVKSKYWAYKPYLRCDDTLWKDLMPRLADAGCNTLIIDLGDAVAYQSHPEISVKNAWTPSRLRDELGAIRKLGMDPVPKLNFSATHDAWLGPYSRKTSTPEYYAACKDLIEETIHLFDSPRHFHLGMDEESQVHQAQFEHVVVRQHDLWWRDFQFFLDPLNRSNIRPWIWSDYYWVYPKPFREKMPKHVLQSNWYYGLDFQKNPLPTPIQTYLDLDQAGFEQVPTGSVYNQTENLEKTVEFCKARLSPNRLLGYMQTVWRPTLNEVRDRHLLAIEHLAKARKLME